MNAKRSTVAKTGKCKRRPAVAQGGRTDWARLRAMGDDDALQAAARDPDNPPRDADWLEPGQLVQPVRKRAISLRLDPDVIEWFRSTGPHTSPA